MATGDSPRKATRTAKKSDGGGASTAKAASARSTRTAKKSASKAVGTARATKAARAGRVEDARQVAAEAQLGEGAAARAIAEADAMHYEAVVNKRGLSVSALTKTLNERWDNGWRLAHILEQRGNTVLVFEKRAELSS